MGDSLGTLGAGGRGSNTDDAKRRIDRVSIHPHTPRGVVKQSIPVGAKSVSRNFNLLNVFQFQFLVLKCFLLAKFKFEKRLPYFLCELHGLLFV